MMTNKKRTELGYNARLSHFNRSHSDARILITDTGTYGKIIDYLDEMAVKKEMLGSVLDRKMKYTFKGQGNIVTDGFRRTLELMGVKSEIKSEIEKMVMRF